MALDLSGRQYAHVAYEEKERLFEEVKKDLRYGDYLFGCYECGICVAACPSARFYDFSPRKIAQTMAREDVDLFYVMLNDSVWDCSQCFSCDVCPRKNSPGGLITLMREVAVKNGLSSAQDALEGYGRVVYKIMATGTQVSPDMLQANAFPDWGPHVKEISENVGALDFELPDDILAQVQEISDETYYTMPYYYDMWENWTNPSMRGSQREK